MSLQKKAYDRKMEKTGIRIGHKVHLRLNEAGWCFIEFSALQTRAAGGAK